MASGSRKQRVEALEAEVARLRERVEGEPSTTAKPWWKENGMQPC
ncbi:MAG TPA: hypothetical protein VKU02_16210 [Gemmataceae bacterium]|nr:hypothetical protein [Gemmataceae bacterium]